MARYGPQFGPDITFLGADRCDSADPATYADADVVIVGAPFDGGTSYRSGALFGPQYIRQTDYLPHDGSRPSLALRTDGLRAFSTCPTPVVVPPVPTPATTTSTRPSVSRQISSAVETR